MSCSCAELHSCMLKLHFNEKRMTTEVLTGLSSFDELEQIFPLVLSLKEEGNKLVKAGSFKKAVTIYTKAAVFLVLGLPRSGPNYHPFRGLAIPLNLNLAICALKLSEFQLAKCLCDCVLRFEPFNVKALFRRASTALRLGQLTATKSDLTMGRRVKSNNSDAVREWNDLIHLFSNSNVGQPESSLGCVDMVIEATSSAPTRLGVQKLGFNPLQLPNKECSNLDEEIGFESVRSNMNEEFVDNLGGSDANFLENDVDPPMLNKDMEDFDYRPHWPFFNPYLAEPKRFSNQSWPDSSLNLSPLDYRKLANGQVLHYGLPRSMGFMSIRVKCNGKSPISNPEMEKSHLSSVTTPDVNERVCTNSKDIQFSLDATADIFNVSHPKSMVLVSQCPPIVSIASGRKPEPHDSSTVIGNLSGFGKSRVVRHRPLAPGTSRGAFKRRLVQSVNRVSKDRVRLVPGMKRKGLSNSFISCYPLWKRRVPLNRLEYGHGVVYFDRGSFGSSTIFKMIYWTADTLEKS